jgi:hypothetical protein
MGSLREPRGRFAQIISIGAYEHAPFLRNPLNDGAALKLTLERIGFEDVRLATNCTRSDLTDILRELTAKVDSESADLFLFYFAGHGIEVDGGNYLVPSDANLLNLDDVESQCVPLSSLTAIAARAGYLGLIILDACRVNPFRSRILETARRGLIAQSVGVGLAGVEAPPNTAVAYAAKEGTVALDGEGRNSPYNLALTEHLGVSGVDVRMVFGRIRDKTFNLTSGLQVPHLYASLGGHELFLHSSNESIDAGEAISLFDRAMRYDLGHGTKRDATEAARLYKKASELGHVGALTKLAQLFARGSGVSQSDERAFELFKLAAAKGDPVAMMHCGICYLNARGVPLSRSDAVQWLRQAAALGNVEAARLLQELE